MTEADATVSLVECEQMDGIIAAAGVAGAREILAAFWRSTEDLIVELNAALDRRDLEAAAGAAHALKGSALNVGAHALSAMATTLERQCREHDLDGARAAIVENERCLERTKTAFSEYLAA
ncbi:MAG: Hpt domain-containing protein [Pseudomonadota bacterium]